MSKGEIVGAVGILLIGGGLVMGDWEYALSGLVTLAVGVVWEVVRKRRIGGDEFVARWRPSHRTLRLLAGLVVVFAVATAWGVYAAIIPAELVGVLLAFAAAAPILAAPFLFFYWRALARARAAAAWPDTVGRIESSYLEEVVSPWPAPIIVYSYAVGGRRYKRSRVRFGGTGAMNPADAEQLLADCPAGAEVPVFYNPKRPGQSCLLPGGGGPNKGLLWGAGLMAGTALLGTAAIALMILLGLVDAALTAIVGHRVLP
jgi:hypothetical protein